MWELSPEERESLHDEHRKPDSTHRQAMFEDCDLCQQELNEALGIS